MTAKLIEQMQNALSLDEVKNIMIEFMEKYANHYHKYSQKNDDPLWPFPSYGETEAPENYS